MVGILRALSRADQCVPASVLFNPPTRTCSPKLYLTPDAYAEKKKKKHVGHMEKSKERRDTSRCLLPHGRAGRSGSRLRSFYVGREEAGEPAWPLKPHSPLNQGELHTSSAAQDTAHSPWPSTLSSSAASWMSSSWFSQEAFVSAMHVHPSPVKLIAHSSDSCHKAACAH